MKVWECLVCGWFYDEAKGWPEDGIAPGTRWEDVPDDWLCPECGVGKQDFEMVEVTQSQQPAIEAADDSPVVIIGTGLAGYNLAREFRKLDKTTPLLLITTDDGRCYSKPMLSTGFTRAVAADDLAQADAGQMAEQLQASIWTFTEVISINTAEQTLLVNTSKSTAYKSLVLAWGADVIEPPMTGNALDKIHTINNLLDYSQFRAAVNNTGADIEANTEAGKEAKRIFIIGAGLIGSEFANDLLNGGFDVEAVDPLAHNLASLLPEAAGRALQLALEEQGAKFHFGTVAESVNTHPSGKGLLVGLASGLTLEADHVISAIGVRPRIKLAQHSGIAVNRGIIANRLLATSAANVYTLGDCAEVEGNVLYYVAPLMAAARALAKTLTGTPTEVEYPAMPVTIKTPACPIVVAAPAQHAEGSWDIQVDSADNKNVIAQFKDVNGQLLGFALTGQGTNEKQALQKQLPAILA